MSRLRESFRKWLEGPKIRPWGILGPILVLLVCLPILRPLRHPEEISDDESARLMTIQNLVEHRTLALDPAHAPESQLIRHGQQYFSDQPPVLAIILSGVYWIMIRCGSTFEHTPALAPYILTLVGATVPVAWTVALIYRMARLFELSRPWRAGLAIASVFGTGLLSYAVVLNPHAPAATMLLAAVGALIHVASSKKPRRGGGWFILAGFCAALAVTFDPPALFIAVCLIVVILTMRMSAGVRVGGVLLFLIGATPPVVLHATASALGSGEFVPVSVRRDLAGRVTVTAPPPPMTQLDFTDDDDLASQSWWLVVGKYTDRLCAALFGAHGLLSHFPVLIFGVFGVGAVMHRHWQAWTKTLAVASAAGALAVIGLYSFSQADWRDAMFATRWFILFVPLVFFWSGAWLKREHSTLIYVGLAVLLAFSTAVSIIGATDPYPRQGFDRYTAAGALMQLIDGGKSETSSPTIVRAK
jgi:hypothetical protein